MIKTEKYSLEKKVSFLYYNPKAMTLLFEILKWFFFFYSLIIGLFFLRWDYILDEEIFNISGDILMPGYLLLCWIMVGYVISLVFIIRDSIEDNDQQNKIYARGLIAGTILGLGFAWIYLFSVI